MRRVGINYHYHYHYLLFSFSCRTVPVPACCFPFNGRWQMARRLHQCSTTFNVRHRKDLQFTKKVFPSWKMIVCRRHLLICSSSLLSHFLSLSLSLSLASVQLSFFCHKANKPLHRSLGVYTLKYIKFFCFLSLLNRGCKSLLRVDYLIDCSRFAFASHWKGYLFRCYQFFSLTTIARFCSARSSLSSFLGYLIKRTNWKLLTSSSSSSTPKKSSSLMKLLIAHIILW